MIRKNELLQIKVGGGQLLMRRLTNNKKLTIKRSKHLNRTYGASEYMTEWMGVNPTPLSRGGGRGKYKNKGAVIIQRQRGAEGLLLVPPHVVG